MSDDSRMKSVMSEFSNTERFQQRKVNWDKGEGGTGEMHEIEIAEKHRKNDQTGKQMSGRWQGAEKKYSSDNKINDESEKKHVV